MIVRDWQAGYFCFIKIFVNKKTITMKSKLLLTVLASCVLTVNLFAQCSVQISAQQSANSTAVTFYPDSISGGSFLSSFSWSFGDGSGGAGSQVSHIYSLGGAASQVYTVCLTMSDSTTGCSTTTCDTVRVYGPSSNNNCTTQISYTNVDSAYTFTSTNSGTGSFTYSWGLDGQIVSTAANPQMNLHDSVGAEYEVCVTVTDSTGCVASNCISITFNDSLSCNTYIASSILDSTYTFTASHIGAAPATYVWTVGNTVISTGPTATYVMSNLPTGQATACVTITDSSGCVSSDCMTLSNFVTGCQAYFVIVPDTANSAAGSYVGYNYSTGGFGSNVVWNFGDGSTSTNPYPSHIYATPGIYIICLTVGTAGTSCFDTYCDSSFYAFKTSGGPMSSLTIEAPSGISDISGNAKLQIYPNPVNNELTISTDKRIEQSRVFNIDGQIVLDRKTSNNKIDVSKLPAGIYVLEMTAEGQVSRTKFVKD